MITLRSYVYFFTVLSQFSENLSILLEVIDQELEKSFSYFNKIEAYQQENASLLLKEIIQVHYLLQLLTIFLAHGSELILSDRVLCLRLLTKISHFADQLEESLPSDEFRKYFSFYLVQFILYLTLHQFHLFEEGSTQIFGVKELSTLKILINRLLNRYRKLFSFGQWLFLQIFLLPLIQIADYNLDQNKSLSDIVFDSNNLLKLQEQESNQIVFDLSPLNLFIKTFSDSLPNYLKDRNFFSIWNTTNLKNGIVTVMTCPNIHTFNFKQFSHFIIHCKGLLMNKSQVSKRGKLFFSEEVDLFSRLPSDVFLQILKFLPYKKIIGLSALNKINHGIIFEKNIFWKELFFRSFSKTFFFEDFIRNPTVKQSELMKLSSLINNPRIDDSKLSHQCQQCFQNLNLEKHSFDLKVLTKNCKPCKRKESNHQWLALFRVNIFPLF